MIGLGETFTIILSMVLIVLAVIAFKDLDND